MEITWPPDCWCRRGKMSIKRSGSHTNNPGRYFYKCPYNIQHQNHFIWCDEFHKDDSMENLPHFLQQKNVHQDHHQQFPKLRATTSNSAHSVHTGYVHKHEWQASLRPTYPVVSSTSIPQSRTGESNVQDNQISESVGGKEESLKMNKGVGDSQGAFLCFCCGCSTSIIILVSVLLLAVIIAKLM